MLDFCTWKEETKMSNGKTKRRIKHGFYQKPMASKMVMMKNSTQPMRLKIVTLTQELIRRMKNTGRSTSLEYRAWEIIDLKPNMVNSGYKEDTIKNVIDSG